MTSLTREAIHCINEHYRLGDACDEAYFYSREDDEAAYDAESKAFRAKVTDADIDAYHAAEIRPPHTIGAAEHNAIVDEYFASLGQ